MEDLLVLTNFLWLDETIWITGRSFSLTEEQVRREMLMYDSCFLNQKRKLSRKYFLELSNELFNCFTQFFPLACYQNSQHNQQADDTASLISLYQKFSCFGSELLTPSAYTCHPTGISGRVPAPRAGLFPQQVQLKERASCLAENSRLSERKTCS